MACHVVKVLNIIIYLIVLTERGISDSNMGCTFKRPRPKLYKDMIRTINTAKIKSQIIRKLGLTDRPHISTPITRQKTCRILESVTKSGPPGKPNGTYAEIQEIISFSEPSDNFQNENIIQFKVFKDNQGRELEVKTADVLVKLKYRRRKKDKIRFYKKRKTWQKFRSNRWVKIILSTVDEKGHAQKPPVAILHATIKKTNWLKLRIPHQIVEDAMHSEDRILRLHIKCLGCVRGATLVLVHGSKRRKKRHKISKKVQTTMVNENGKKVRMLKTRRKRRLSKTRPFLILHTKVQTFIRSRRSAPNCVGDGDTMCCKSEFVFSFFDVGWQDWVMSPAYFVTGDCSGLCGAEPSAGNSTGANANTGNTRQTCAPTRYSPLQMTYYDRSATLVTSTLPNMIVEECGCQRRNT